MTSSLNKFRTALAVLLTLIIIIASTALLPAQAFSDEAQDPNPTSAEEPNSGSANDANDTDTTDSTDNTGSSDNASGTSDTGSSSADSSELDEDETNMVNPHQLPDSSFIYDTSIIDLSTADAYYDGQTVQIIGEAVGDIIKADNGESHCWITLAAQDSKSNASIVVYMSKEDADKIDLLGRYGVTGTTLQVRGTYQLACSEHDGLSDIHAEHVSVIARGEQHPKELDIQSFIPGAVVVLVGLGLLVTYSWMRERRR